MHFLYLEGGGGFAESFLGVEQNAARVVELLGALAQLAVERRAALHRRLERVLHGLELFRRHVPGKKTGETTPTIKQIIYTPFFSRVARSSALSFSISLRYSLMATFLLTRAFCSGLFLIFFAASTYLERRMNNVNHRFFFFFVVTYSRVAMVSS